MDVTIHPLASMNATIVVPGDKSISHRALMLAAIADGTSVIRNLAPGDDVKATVDALKTLGVEIGVEGNDASVQGIGNGEFPVDEATIDCRNSGTTARLLCGLLAAREGRYTLTGDESLSRRPMQRVIEPLAQMGAEIDSADGRLPITIRGRELQGINYQPKVASAQVKSAILFAGLRAKGTTTVVERMPTRDHSEILLQAQGAQITASSGNVEIGASAMAPLDLTIPGDFSSAAPFIAMSALSEGRSVLIRNVGLNPRRTGLLKALTRMGARIDLNLDDPMPNSEVRGAVRVSGVPIQGIHFNGSDIVDAIDEVPLVALLGAIAWGNTIISDAQELRAKESDRISATIAALMSFGANAFDESDGLSIDGPQHLTGASIVGSEDHRMVMLAAVAATIANTPTKITNADAVSVSYPGFFEDLANCGVDIEVQN